MGGVLGWSKNFVISLVHFDGDLNGTTIFLMVILMGIFMVIWINNGIFHGIFMGFLMGHNGDIIWSFASLRNGKSPIFSR